VAEAVQKKVHSRVAGVVSKCLACVFGEDAYTFEIRFEKARGRTAARPLFLRGDKELDPADGVGGGVLDVTAFALRVVCLVLKRPAKRLLLVADEPFKHLSAGYRDSAASMVLMLAEEFGMQFVLVTHSEQFKIGHVVDLSRTP